MFLILSLSNSIFILFSSLSVINLDIFSLIYSLPSNFIIEHELLLFKNFSLFKFSTFKLFMILSLCLIIVFNSFIWCVYCSISFLNKLFSPVNFSFSLHTISNMLSFLFNSLLNSSFFSSKFLMCSIISWNFCSFISLSFLFLSS